MRILFFIAYLLPLFFFPRDMKHMILLWALFGWVIAVIAALLGAIVLKTPIQLILDIMVSVFKWGK